jgi:hypothetical protein
MVSVQNQMFSVEKKRYWRHILIVLTAMIMFCVLYFVYEYREQRKVLDGSISTQGAPQSNGGIFFSIDDPRHPDGPNYNPKLFEIQEAAQSTSTVDMTPTSVQSDQSQ